MIMCGIFYTKLSWYMDIIHLKNQSLSTNYRMQRMKLAK